MKDIDKKLAFSMGNLTGLSFIFSAPTLSYFAKRTLLRRFYILMDSCIKLIPAFNNELHRQEKISSAERNSMREKINRLADDWERFSIIRDKLSAHSQDIDLVSLIGWWNSIDYTLTSTFLTELSEITDFYKHKGIFTLNIPGDYVDVDYSSHLHLAVDNNFYLSHGRVGLAKENTVSLIPLNKFQEQCSAIVSLQEFIEVCCNYTIVFEGSNTLWGLIMFESAWALLACDCMSLIDLLYNNTKYNEPLSAVAPTDWGGLQVLKDGERNRNQRLEQEIIEYRNKYAAHIDSDMPMEDLCIMAQNFNFKSLHLYIAEHINVFRNACMSDIRTKMFCISSKTPLNGVVGLSYSGAKTINN